jgi:anti-sigma B factor antagonist
MPEPSLRVRQEDDVVVASFNQTKIVEMALIQEIGKELQAVVLQAVGGRKLLLDFSGVEYMSSLMIGQIMRVLRQCRQDQIGLKLCSITPEIRDVFKVTGLTKMLEICPSEAKAMEAFGATSEE